MRRRAASLLLTIGLTVASLDAQSVVPPPVAPAQPPALDQATLTERIDTLLSARATLRDFSGAVVLTRGGVPLFAKAYGSANLEWQIPNTLDTKFRIGSLTKSFTAMLIMQLREQGALKLDDSVCMYVTPCPPSWQPITLHHLLTHTSGIRSYTALAEFNETNMVPKDREHMLSLLKTLMPQWAPGDHFDYSNSGYYILGVVIERVTGERYERALARMILEPLGMSDTGYDSARAILPRRASGYVGFVPKRSHAAAIDMQAPFSAGGLYSTAEDLVKWDNAVTANRLVTAASRQLMWAPVRGGYGYGWMVYQPAASFFGYGRVGHTGTIDGFASVLLKLPEANLSVIVLSNNGSINVQGLARDVLAVYFGGTYFVPTPRPVVAVRTDVLDTYVGTYRLDEKFDIVVMRDGESLVMTPRGQGRVDLFAESTTSFFAKAVELTIEFVRTPDGTISHLVLRQGGRGRDLARVK